MVVHAQRMLVMIRGQTPLTAVLPEGPECNQRGESPDVKLVTGHRVRGTVQYVGRPTILY